MADTSWIPRVKGVTDDDVQATVTKYMDLHDDNNDKAVRDRAGEYKSLVNQYYNLVTEFYEWGRMESFEASLARHEHWLALRMGLEKGMRVLDVGCGVGGPAREIARYTGCHVTGLNLNEYHIKRATQHSKMLKMDRLTTFHQGDFMAMPFEDNSFDAVFQIEATAHAPSKAEAYAEIYRVLKPGGYFGSYEWCLTDVYDPDNEAHRAIKKGIEIGNALPNISTTEEVIRAERAVGFIVVEEEDRGIAMNDLEYPWWDPLTFALRPFRLQHSALGHKVMISGVKLMEKVGFYPPGTVGVQEVLREATVNLVAGGRTGVFTPAFFTLCKKPLEKEEEKETERRVEVEVA